MAMSAVAGMFPLAYLQPEAHVPWVVQEDRPDDDGDEIASEEEHVLASRRSAVGGEAI